MFKCLIATVFLLGGVAGTVAAQTSQPATTRPGTHPDSVPTMTPSTRPDRLAALRLAVDRAEAERLKARADCLRRLEASEPYKALAAELAAKQARLDKATPGRDGAGVKLDAFAVLGAKKRLERMRAEAAEKGDAATAKADLAAKKAHAAYVDAVIAEKGSILADHRGAKRVVFVCDAGGRMINKFATSKDQLSKAIAALRPDQAFGIVFIVDGKYVAMNEKSLVVATPANQRLATAFLEGVTTTGQSQASPAVALAFRLQPQMIHLVMGDVLEENEKLAEEIRGLNRGRQVQIHTVSIDAFDEASVELLRTIATENGGRFDRLVEPDLPP